MERSTEYIVQAHRQEAQHDFHREYILEDRLGQGTYGTVFAASGARGHVAVKVVDLRAQAKNGGVDARLVSAVRREVAVLRALPKSPNIVAFHDRYASGGLVYMVMEHGGVGLLPALEGMEVLTEETLQPLFRDMLSAIVACHAVSIVHRDVKPTNFLAAPAAGGLAVKLCDFGVATSISDVHGDELEGVFGTPPFMAPEMLGGHCYGAKVDVWAVGVIAYVLLFGAWPYTPTTMTGTSMKAAILLGSPLPRFRSSPGMPQVSRRCSEWVQALLRRKTSARPSAHAALRQLGVSTAWGAGVCMRPALSSAKRAGAFGAEDDRRQPPTDLDRLSSQMNAAAQGGCDPEVAAACGERRQKWTSEASTAADSRNSP